jgi:hypothetical protein
MKSRRDDTNVPFYLFFFRDAPELGLEGKLRVEEVSGSVMILTFLFICFSLEMLLNLDLGRLKVEEVFGNIHSFLFFFFFRVTPE